MTTTIKKTTVKSAGTVAKTAKTQKPKAATVKADLVEETTKKNAISILDSIDKSLFVRKPRGGNSRESFLKEELFKDMDEKKQKSFRRQIRTSLHKFSESFKFYQETDDKKKLMALKVEFDKFYSQFFKTNDYSLNSIAGNVKPKVKEEFQNMLNIIKSVK